MALKNLLRPAAGLICLLVLLGANPAPAEPIAERSLSLAGEIADDGSWVEFNWPKATGSRVGRVTIQRRLLGQTGTQTWRDLDSVRGFARIYRDEDVRPGVAYEYRISRPSKERVETGYWATGVELPAEEQRGVALVVVDQSLAAKLAPRLDRFLLDLAGDGWKVVRHDVPRGSRKDPVANLRAARKIRGWIQDQYNSAFYLPHALILVGHVPVVKSGTAKPDGHKPRPLETDLFYADSNAIWLDDGMGVLLHSGVPSDHIEMQVGRIDFSGMDDALGDEITLLRRYFDKNHNWRHGRLGDLRQAYGGSDHLFVEHNGLRNIVGAENFTAGGHHDAGTRQPWLLGVDFGKAGYANYTSDTPIEAVFTINFGSGKLDFSRRNNTMKALLAQPWYCLSTGWGGRPAWQLHHLALGKSIGYSHLRTVNNGALSQGGPATLEYRPTGNYPWINPIWVNLLGDPTLRPFPSPPVRDLRARMDGGRVRLDWQDAEAGRQYRIYRAADRLGPYQALNPDGLHGERSYIDEDPRPGAWYMVRAYSLQQVHAGSFYHYSQGTFASTGNQPPRAGEQSISTPAGQAVRLRPSATDPDAGDTLTISLIHNPPGGRLLQSGGEWSFIPEAGFSGRVEIPFTVFDGSASDDGVIRLDVQ